MIDQSGLNAARQAWKNGDYHAARDIYQQIAYGYNNFTELEKEAFSREVADFAGDDPMYQQILQLVITQIQNAGEPVLQSKLTGVIKQEYGERGAELLRYVLYYADYRDELKREKKGRSYLLSLPKGMLKNRNTNQVQKSISQQIYFDGNAVYTPPQEDLIQIQHINDYYDLQRKATEFKGNNWDLSLACLYKAKSEAEDSDIVVTDQNHLRFPLFLQQAGKFEEAKTELQYLFDSADEYAKSQVGNWTKYKVLYANRIKATFLEYLFDKARLIYKREKQLEKAEEFQALSLKYREQASAIQLKIDKKEKRELEEFEQEQAELSAPSSSVKALLNGINELDPNEVSPIQKQQEKIFKNKNDVRDFLVGAAAIGFIAWLIWGWL